jgi:hypothetical protein
VGGEYGEGVWGDDGIGGGKWMALEIEQSADRSYLETMCDILLHTLATECALLNPSCWIVES